MFITSPFLIVKQNESIVFQKGTIEKMTCFSENVNFNSYLAIVVKKVSITFKTLIDAF